MKDPINIAMGLLLVVVGFVCLVTVVSLMATLARYMADFLNSIADAKDHFTVQYRHYRKLREHHHGKVEGN